MNLPLGSNTLADAAGWLAETTGAAWSERQVLDAVFRYTLEATLRELEDAETEGRAAFATGTVAWAAQPAETRFCFRRWTVEAGTERRPPIGS